MTAIIGILNKTTVALAADSAATVGPDGNSKVYNHANKIFNLTNGNPVGIAIYGMDEVMGVPWETIIKMYRQQFPHHGFDTLQQYGDDFLGFLQTMLVKYVDANEQANMVRLITRSVIQEVSTTWKSTLENEYGADLLALPEADQAVHRSVELSETIESVYTNISSYWGALPQFSSYALSDFIFSYGLIVEEEGRSLLDATLTSEQIDALKVLAHMMVGNKFFYESTTGIVISGFGEAEIYPSLISYQVGGIANNIVRYTPGNGSVISKQQPADVVPFAQTDSMWAFLKGISPKMQQRVVDLMDVTLGRFSQRVLDKLAALTTTSTVTESSDSTEPNVSEPTPALSPEHTSVLENEFADAAKSLLSNLKTEIEEATTNDNLLPILITIITLSKEDLAEMAESLINLTYLQRRMSFSQESVGGPVDVALITKGDGFVWVKRKHYFKPELNLNYLARVLQGNGHTKNQLL